MVDPTLTDALSRQRTKLVLGDIQPTAVLGGVTKLDAANQLPCPFWFEGFVERAFGVCVQIVTDQNHFLTRRVTTFE